MTMTMVPKGKCLRTQLDQLSAIQVQSSPGVQSSPSDWHLQQQPLLPADVCKWYLQFPSQRSCHVGSIYVEEPFWNCCNDSHGLCGIAAILTHSSWDKQTALRMFLDHPAGPEVLLLLILLLPKHRSLLFPFPLQRLQLDVLWWSLVISFFSSWVLWAWAV